MKYFRINKRIFIVVLFVNILLACAKISAPTGGPVDKNPPSIENLTFVNQSKNISTNLKEIKMDFDEYVVLKNPDNQIIISPPLENKATFEPASTAKKYVSVKFNETLRDNTTYAINFGQSIQDYNEGNKLSNFIYVFSTGDYIDSLQTKGVVRKLKAIKEFDDKIFVGLYKKDSNYSDSTLMKQKPYYVSRPDSSGLFKFNYLGSGTYHIFAVSDYNKDLKYTPGIDEVGFIDETIHLPHDSIQIKPFILFKEKSPFKVKSGTHEDWGKIRVDFNGNPQDIQLRNQSIPTEPHYLTYSTSRDSVYYWFKQPTTDTLKNADKNGKIYLEILKNKQVIDTLEITKRSSFKPSPLKLKEEKSADDFALFKILSSTPIQKINREHISVLDGENNPLAFTIIQDEKNPFSVELDFGKKYKKNYKIDLLPNAIVDFFDQTNKDSLKFTQSTKDVHDYSKLTLTLVHKPESHCWVQLLKDNIVQREVYTKDNTIVFNGLLSGYYTAKIIVDSNNNSFWDTGDFIQQLQPEPIYYFNQEMYLNNYSEKIFEWDIGKSEQGAPLSEKKIIDGKTNTIKGKDQPKKIEEIK